MTPSIPVPTDNIYKFSALFGLAIIVSGIFSFAAMYSFSLNTKVKYAEAVLALESKAVRTKLEDDTLAMTNRLIKVTQSNEENANYAIGGFIGVGILLSWFGWMRWYKVIQPRDDQIADLQKLKLEAEIAKLRSETSPSQQSPQTSDKATRRTKARS